MLTRDVSEGLDDLLVAHVTRVSGTAIRAKVLAEKNEAYLIHDGELIRNVSVGGYVRMPYGFSDIVGVIEGEEQVEVPPSQGVDEGREFRNISFERFIDISVFGTMRGGKMVRGSIFLPLVSSAVYVLTNEELALINSFQNDDDPRSPFRVGWLATQPEIGVFVPMSNLFASHIGIFGNTGSGKSNTLTRLYSDLFDEIDDAQMFRDISSKFFFIDFNGEYEGEGVLTPNKKVIRLDTSTRSIPSRTSERIPVPRDFYDDVDIWSILSRATERTQKPFLRRVFRLKRKIETANDSAAYSKGILENLLKGYYASPRDFMGQRQDIIRLFGLIANPVNREDGEEKASLAVDEIEPDTRDPDKPGLKIRSKKRYGDTPEKLLTEVFKDLMDLVTPESLEIITNNPIYLLRFCCLQQFIDRCRNGSIQRDNIAGLIPRLREQLDESEKIYSLAISGHFLEEFGTVTVFSLLRVNLEQKKLIPLILTTYAYRDQKSRSKEGAGDCSSSFHLVIDEAHNILSSDSVRESESWRDYRLETFEEIIKEGRKFGAYLTISSQRPSDISPTILSQIHNFFIHRLVNEEDLASIRHAVSFIDSSTFGMIPTLPQGTCVLSGQVASYPTLVQIDRLGQGKRPESDDRDLAQYWMNETSKSC